MATQAEMNEQIISYYGRLNKKQQKAVLYLMKIAVEAKLKTQLVDKDGGKMASAAKGEKGKRLLKKTKKK